MRTVGVLNLLRTVSKAGFGIGDAVFSLYS
jgi:hypothetical protein